jgi:hypothetical protein
MHPHRLFLQWFLLAASSLGTAATVDAQQVDLRNTAMAEKIEQLLAGLASGNDSVATVQTLSLDNRAWLVRLEADVRSQRRSFGKVRYSFHSVVSLGLDLRTGETFDERLTIQSRSGTVDVVPDAIRTIVENGLAKALDVAAEGDVATRETRSDYDRTRDWYYSRHGRDNVYFASRSFVRWAGAGSTAGGWVRDALLAGNDAPAELMRQARTHSLREVAEVAEWLEHKGQPDAEAVAYDLLSGERVRWPNLVLQWQPVRYASRLSVDGRQVGEAFDVNRHAAFALIWIGPGGSDHLVSTYQPSGGLDNEGPRAAARPRRRFTRTSSRQSIELTRVSCFRTQDKVGWDEVELRIWVDGRRQTPHNRSMDNGYVWDLRLRLDFEESLRIELWDLDRRSGDDFIGEVRISSENLSGSRELYEGIGHYRMEWSEPGL